jgi:density-regulated protein
MPEALEAATASLSIEAQKRAAKDAQKKAAKAEAAEQKQADKLANSVITIKRIERNKKKFVTAVSGLEAFGLELKKVSSSSHNLPPIPYSLLRTTLLMPTILSGTGIQRVW